MPKCCSRKIAAVGPVHGCAQKILVRNPRHCCRFTSALVFRLCSPESLMSCALILHDEWVRLKFAEHHHCSEHRMLGSSMGLRSSSVVVCHLLNVRQELQATTRHQVPLITCWRKSMSQSNSARQIHIWEQHQESQAQATHARR